MPKIFILALFANAVMEKRDRKKHPQTNSQQNEKLFSPF